MIIKISCILLLIQETSIEQNFNFTLELLRFIIPLLIFVIISIYNYLTHR